MPIVRELPARTDSRVTFGSFNNLAKISLETVALWSRVLAEVPNSRLMIKGHYFADAGTRERFCRRFSEYGVAGDRLLLFSEPRGAVEHYDTLNRVDIALDTVPYNGTTTTCEALWMGVPVIVLAGARHASRVGVSLLKAAGLPELIAPTPDAYVGLARALARDLGGLAALRTSLRARLAGSPLLDTRQLTRDLEATYRTLWRQWCAGVGMSSPELGENATVVPAEREWKG
jgi:predicted O-linked N-acetylglucosamine transferase (SPINDLY family)